MPNIHPLRQDDNALSEDLLIDMVEIFKAISDPTRAQLLFLLTAASTASTTWPSMLR